MTDAAAAPERRGRGRPRSRGTDDAIVEATIELLQRHGIGGLSIEGVAQRAGVAKTTVYRRWPGKHELVLDVLTRMRGPMPPLPPGGSVRDDLVFILSAAWTTHLDPARGSLVMRRVLSEIDEYPELARAFIVDVLGPRRQRLLDVLGRGVREGAIRADVDLTLMSETLVAPILVAAWVPFGPRVRPTDVPVLVDLLLQGVAPAPDRRPGASG